MRWRALLASGGALLSVGPIVAIVVSPSPSALGACLGAAGPAGGTLSYAQLEGLWVQGGGSTAVAPTAAAIAMAESGGKAQIQQGQPYATTGWGYWQITPGNSEPQFGVDQAMLVPINNARAAVAKYTAAGGFSPWTTYTSGAYLAFMQGGSPQGASPSSGISCAPAGQVIGNAQLGPTTDPVPGAAMSRLDMGFDGTSQTFLAPFSGVIAYSTASDSGWQGGGYVAVQSAQDPSMCFYAAEGLTPTVQQSQTVQVGQVIATPRPSPYNGIVGNFEVGRCYPQNPRDTLAHNVADPRAMVMAFYAWMESLGAGPTTNPSGAGFA